MLRGGAHGTMKLSDADCRKAHHPGLMPDQIKGSVALSWAQRRNMSLTRRDGIRVGQLLDWAVITRKAKEPSGTKVCLHDWRPSKGMIVSDHVAWRDAAISVRPPGLCLRSSKPLTRRLSWQPRGRAVCRCLKQEVSQARTQPGADHRSCKCSQSCSDLPCHH